MNARELDQKDPLKSLRSRFHFPKRTENEEVLYFVGNSLGLMPRKAADYVEQELADWREMAIGGHLHGKTPWYSYHESLTESTARLVGAKPIEVVVMNSLTVNVHLLLISFYRPTAKRFKILVEKGAFPSDQYAVASQAKLHGYDPKTAIVEVDGEQVIETIEKQGESIATVLLGNVNYLTGRAFPLAEIAKAAHAKGCIFGVDLAHGAGNLKLSLHDWDVDFAAWCSYKYLNAGPGAIGGAFIHERHARSFDLPRLAGWWGHDKVRRFQMEKEFQPMAGAEGWQLSNPPIFQMAALRASMEIFDEVGMEAIRAKSDKLTSFLEAQLEGTPYRVLTPKLPHRGSHISLETGPGGKKLLEYLHEQGVYCDYREPGVLRVAPVALYNSFEDVARFSELLIGYDE